MPLIRLIQPLGGLLAAVLLASPAAVSAATADTPAHARIYVGEYKGTTVLDGNIDNLIIDFPVEGNLDTVITVDEWEMEAPDQRGQLNGQGSISVDGNIDLAGTSVQSIDETFEFSDDSLELDLSNEHLTFDPLSLTTDSGLSIDFDSVDLEYSLEGFFLQGEADFSMESGIGTIEGTATFNLTRQDDPPKDAVPMNPVYSYLFDYNKAMWDFKVPPEFTPSNGVYDPDDTSLRVDTQSNQNTFAFWEALPFRLPSPADSETIVRLTGKVGSDAQHESDTPTFRFRVSSEDFNQSAGLQITSHGNGALSPRTGQDLFYTQYVRIIPGEEIYRPNFGVLNFQATNTAETSMYLRNITTQEKTTLTNRRSEMSYDFRGGAQNGFITADTGVHYERPLFTATNEGLRIGADLSQPNEDQVGFWVSSDETNTVTLEDGRVYEAIFTVVSEAAPENRAAVPSFRARLNDGSLRTSAEVHVESITNDSRVPDNSTAIDYHVFLEVPPENDGEPLLMAFDYILIQASKNDPNIGVTLQEIEVVSYEP